MSATQRNDPYANYCFLVEIDGLVVGGFSEVSGLQVETEVEEYREGGINDMVHKLPKGSKQSNITLKRGITDSNILWLWHQSVVQGLFMRHTGRIILTDTQGNEKVHWLFLDAYPVKWVGPELSADGNATAVETLELVQHGLYKW